MAVVYLCLMQSVEYYKRDADPQCAAAFDPREILEILKRDFGRMNYLWSIAGMSEDANDQRSDEILKLFTGGVTNG